jgi:NADP-dependent 3-hydroxy acid dehydrogenase YdfG
MPTVSLSGKIAVVTGASSGIGAAVARQLTAGGARAALLARSADKLAALAAELPGSLAVACDVADEASVTAAFARIESEFGTPDILVNNAGTGFATDLATASLADLRRIFETNVTGVFLCTRAVLGAMKARGSGHIVNVSSITGKVSNPNAPLYCASKHALNGYSSGLQQQVAAAGVRVSLVSPAAVDTAYWDGRPVDRSKFLAADEVADAILFILTRPPGVLIKDLDLAAFR